MDLDTLRKSDLRGAALREALVEQTDEWLSGLLVARPGLALVAVGGYGRREPALGSDLDLVLLHSGGSITEVSEVADAVWYPVWDAGISLDHSVRTVDEAVAVADQDLKAALGLLDVRHVAGDPALTTTLRDRVLSRWRATAKKRLPELRESSLERSSRHGELAFLLEPDLKESRGGLRDFHALRAAAAAWVADSPDERATAAYTLLLDVRGELHRLVAGRGRPSDRLRLQDQDAVADALGYDDADALMVAVSGAGRSIAFAADTMWRRVDGFLATSPRWIPGRRRGPDRRPLAPDVVAQAGEVVLARDADPWSDPVLVLRVAGAAASASLPIAPITLERLLTESAPMPEPWPDDVRDAFVALLGAGHAAVPVLESLDQWGLFVRLLPEWEAVRSRPQRNAYHRFTVDRHLLEAAAEAAALTRRVGRPDLLLMGALLHDIGKGFPGDHTTTGMEVVARIAPRMGYDADDCAVLVDMVRHHLLLPDVATRRDLDDPATVQAVADAVGSRSTLELLHGLAEADSLATGPAAWSEWKSGLITELVRRALLVLEGEAPPTPRGLPTERQRELMAAGALALEANGDEVTVVYPDRPGVLALLAGVMALHRLDIRSVDAVSEGSMGVVVLDTQARFGGAPDWGLVREDLRHALDGGLPVGQRLAEQARHYAPAAPVAPARVLWVDDASHTASVVEVRAADGVGVLHRIATALASCGLDVRSARCSSLGAEVVDAFYVLDAAGATVDDQAQRDKVTVAVLTALS